MDTNKKKRPLTVKPRYTLAQTMAKFSSEAACKEYLRQMWPALSSLMAW